MPSPKPRPNYDVMLSGENNYRLNGIMPKPGEMWNSWRKVVEVQEIPQKCIITEPVPDTKYNSRKFIFL